MTLFSCLSKASSFPAYDGECTGYDNGTFAPLVGIKNDMVLDADGYGSFLNDSTSEDQVLVSGAGKRLEITNQMAFCRCDNSNRNAGRQWVFTSEYETTQNIISYEYGGVIYKLLDLTSTTGEELPFLVGTMMFHLGNLHPVPAETVQTNISACIPDQDGNNDGTNDGRIYEDAISNRLLKVVIKPKSSEMASGQFEVAIPTIVSRRKLELDNGGMPGTPSTVLETVMQLTLLRVVVHNRCEFSNSSGIYTIDLGAVNANQLKEDSAPEGDYEPRELTINFRCNSSLEEINLADFYLEDSNDLTNTTNTLTTNLNGVGVIMESNSLDRHSGKLDLQNRYNK